MNIVVLESSTPTTDSSTNVMEMPTATPSNYIISTLSNSSQTIAVATPKTSLTGLPSNNSSAVAEAVAGVVAGLVVCIAVAVLLIIL